MGIQRQKATRILYNDDSRYFCCILQLVADAHPDSKDTNTVRIQHIWGNDHSHHI